MQPEFHTYTPDTRDDLSLMHFICLIAIPLIAAALIVRMPYVESFLVEHFAAQSRHGAMQIIFLPLLGIVAFLARKRE